MTGWPLVPLGELLIKSEERVKLNPLERYTQVTVKLWGQGVVPRNVVMGEGIGSDSRQVVRKNQFLLSRIDARHGAVGLVPESLDGAVVSNDFPSFSIVKERLDPRFLKWYTRTSRFVDGCRAASEGTTNRVRLKEDRFLKLMIPLPQLEEQRRIVEQIEGVGMRVEEANRLQTEVESGADALLMSAYIRIAHGAPRKPLGDVAPLNRRPLAIEFDRVYPQVAVRSFGRGSFHREPLVASEVTWEKPFVVESGDILISNIKAWEGAIAVATEADHQFVCSHRYLTCVPIPEIATARFVCFHLLSPDGLRAVGEASPGSADRNRTLGTKALLRIPVPVPPYHQQLQFDEYSKRMDELKTFRKQSTRELEALIPSLTARLLGFA